MAALEKIRKRAVILTIVIGLALLAFILEEGVRSMGAFNNDTTVAKIGDTKIDYRDFQARLDQQDKENQNTDGAQLQKSVLEQMVTETLLSEECEKAGISVGEDEMSAYILGDKPAQATQKFAQKFGGNLKEIYEIAKNPKKYYVKPGKDITPEQADMNNQQVYQVATEWEQLQEDVANEVKNNKLGLVVTRCLQANDIDRKQMLEDNANTFYVEYLHKDYSTVPDDKYKVTDAELKAAYEKYKNMFRIDEPQRRVHYIALRVDPSADDKSSASKQVNDIFGKLQNEEGISGVRSAKGVKSVDSTIVTNVEAKRDSSIQKIIAMNVGGTLKVDPVGQSRVTTMYKLLESFSMADSIMIDVVNVSDTLKEKVLAELNGGKKLDEIQKAYAAQGVRAQAGTQPLRGSQIPDTLRAKISGAGEGFFELDKQTFTDDKKVEHTAYTLARVTSKKAPKTFYKLAVVTHETYPSTATIDGLRTKLQTYLNKHKTAAAFENAKELQAAGLEIREEVISESTPMLGAQINPMYGMVMGGIQKTRKAVRWAFENKPGAVSPIFNDNSDYLVAIAVDAAYEGEFSPLTDPDVKKTLTAMVINDKKGDALVKEYTGKATDIAGYAKLMGVQSDTTQVSFGANGMGVIEPTVVGRIVAAKQGVVSAPIKGKTAVYVFKVNKVEKSERKLTDDELNRQYVSEKLQGVNFINALKFARKVKVNALKFI